MSIIKTSCGIINIDKLLTVNKGNYHITGWAVVLKYSNKTQDIHLSCKDEKEADECIDQIFKAIEDNKPTYGSVRMTR